MRGSAWKCVGVRRELVGGGLRLVRRGVSGFWGRVVEKVGGRGEKRVGGGVKELGEGGAGTRRES